jgi:hypothetical protein
MCLVGHLLVGQRKRPRIVEGIRFPDGVFQQGTGALVVPGEYLRESSQQRCHHAVTCRFGLQRTHPLAELHLLRDLTAELRRLGRVNQHLERQRRIGARFPRPRAAAPGVDGMFDRLLDIKSPVRREAVRSGTR